jgi:excisionase family DNA binding protein
MEVLTPSEDEVTAARELEAKLLRSATGSEVRLVFSVGGEEYIVLKRASGFFEALVREVAQGHPVGLVDLNAELSTTEAAALLGVSRPTLVGLLKKNVIPHRLVGTHRRVPHTALLEYKKQHASTPRRTVEERLRATDELLRQWHEAEEPGAS